MNLIRSLIFNIVFYASTAIQLIFWLPVFFIMPRHECWKVVKFWALFNLWFHHKIIGTRFEFRGLENIPHSGGLIVAAKHQSSWETYTIVLFFADSIYILKQILKLVPLFGWYITKMQVVALDRSRGKQALATLSVNAKKHYDAGRQIIIYPEGTRKLPGAAPAYKYGITHLYGEIGARVLPVALNSGLFWRKNSFTRLPGTIVMEFLEVIEPGLSKDKFSHRLQTVIEDKTRQLRQEAEQTSNE